MVEDIKALEERVTEDLKNHSDLAVAATIYKCAMKATREMRPPEAVEMVVRSIRESARREQIREMAVPGMQ